MHALKKHTHTQQQQLKSTELELCIVFLKKPFFLGEDTIFFFLQLMLIF